MKPSPSDEWRFVCKSAGIDYKFGCVLWQDLALLQVDTAAIKGGNPWEVRSGKWEMEAHSSIRVSLILQNVHEWLHNDFLGAILCQSHPKKNSDFYLHFWPLAPHIGGAVGANGKTAQKWLKKYQISKLAENLSKSWKHLKPNAIPLFLFGHPKCHFWARKKGTFGNSAHLYVPKNGTSGAQTKIWRPLL